MTFERSSLADKDYREKIYSRYEILAGTGSFFNKDEALRWGRSYRKLLKLLLPQDKDAVILDLGCGNGRLLYNMQFMGYTRLHGIDLSPENVRVARQIFDSVFQEDVFAYLGGKKEEFDVITAFDFFEHFTKEEFMPLLDMCYEGLRPGGLLILQTVNAHSPMGLSRRYTDFTHEISVTPGCLRNMMTFTGFVDFVARERGPIPYNTINCLRWIAWKLLRLAFQAYDIIEVAGTSGSIYTRDFVACARKPGSAKPL